MDHKRLRAILLDPACEGAGDIHLLAREGFWNDDALPFQVAGGGSVLRVVPDAALTPQLFASTDDERHTIVPCHDAPGWLVPSATVAGWLTRHVSNSKLDDLLLSHPLYSYLTAPDDDGLSRGGMARLVHWTPAMPHIATIVGPEFLPMDPDAPEVNRVRTMYADAVIDLLLQLEQAFDVEEVELGILYSRPQKK